MKKYAVAVHFCMCCCPDVIRIMGTFEDYKEAVRFKSSLDVKNQNLQTSFHVLDLNKILTLQEILDEEGISI